MEAGECEQGAIQARGSQVAGEGQQAFEGHKAIEGHKAFEGLEAFEPAGYLVVQAELAPRNTVDAYNLAGQMLLPEAAQRRGGEPVHDETYQVPTILAIDAPDPELTHTFCGIVKTAPLSSTFDE